MDSMTRRQRSRHMSQIRVSGSQPELMMRQAMRRLTDLPMKYNVKNLMGKPDIVIPSLKLAIFVDGCFWHGCPTHGKFPKSHVGYWQSKIVQNMIRDEEAVVSLEEDGWAVWRVWEHDLKPETIVRTRRKLGNKFKKLLASWPL